MDNLSERNRNQFCLAWQPLKGPGGLASCSMQYSHMGKLQPISFPLRYMNNGILINIYGTFSARDPNPRISRSEKPGP